MSQVSAGLVDVANGSATVNGTDTVFTDASPGDLFVVVGDIVSYEISNVVSDTELTLTAPYGGTTENLVDYVIHTAFTPNKQYPYPERGDFETATIVKRAIKEIDDSNYVGTSDLNNHTNDTTNPHQVTASQVGSPTQSEFDNHTLDESEGVHGSTVVPTADKLIHRDANGRSQVESPSVDKDIANKAYTDTEVGTVQSNLDTHTSDTSVGVHGTGTAAFENTGTAPGEVPTNADLPNSSSVGTDPGQLPTNIQIAPVSSDDTASGYRLVFVGGVLAREEL